MAKPRTFTDEQDQQQNVGREQRDESAAPSNRIRSDVPNQEEIAHRAHEIFRERGAEHGHDVDDWLQAEQELRRHRQQSQ